MQEIESFLRIFKDIARFLLKVENYRAIMDLKKGFFIREDRALGVLREGSHSVSPYSTYITPKLSMP